MTITVRQPSTPGGDLTDAASFGSGLVAKNTLLMWAADYNVTAAPSAPEVGGSAFACATLLTGCSDGYTGANDVSYAFWLGPVTSAMAGATSLTYSDAGSGGPIKLYALELVSGNTIQFDNKAVNTGNSTTGSCGPTPGTASPGELAVYALPVFSSYPDVSTGGWTIIGNQDYMSGGYQILGAAGSAASVTAPISGGANQWAAAIITLRETCGLLAAGIV